LERKRNGSTKDKKKKNDLSYELKLIFGQPQIHNTVTEWHVLVVPRLLTEASQFSE
jgi:hypothetical protein